MWEDTVEEKGVTRRLTATLAADLVGYSRLMAADEQGTLDALKKNSAKFMDPTIASLLGSVAKTKVDAGLL